MPDFTLHKCPLSAPLRKRARQSRSRFDFSPTIAGLGDQLQHRNRAITHPANAQIVSAFHAPTSVRGIAESDGEFYFWLDEPTPVFIPPQPLLDPTRGNLRAAPLSKDAKQLLSALAGTCLGMRAVTFWGEVCTLGAFFEYTGPPLDDLAVWENNRLTRVNKTLLNHWWALFHDGGGCCLFVNDSDHLAWYLHAERRFVITTCELRPGLERLAHLLKANKHDAYYFLSSYNLDQSFQT